MPRFIPKPKRVEIHQKWQPFNLFDFSFKAWLMAVPYHFHSPHTLIDTGLKIHCRGEKKGRKKEERKTIRGDRFIFPLKHFFQTLTSPARQKYHTQEVTQAFTRAIPHPSSYIEAFPVGKDSPKTKLYF